MSARPGRIKAVIDIELDSGAPVAEARVEGGVRPTTASWSGSSSATRSLRAGPVPLPDRPPTRGAADGWGGAVRLPETPTTPVPVAAGAGRQRPPPALREPLAPAARARCSVSASAWWSWPRLWQVLPNAASSTRPSSPPFTGRSRLVAPAQGRHAVGEPSAAWSGRSRLRHRGRHRRAAGPADRLASHVAEVLNPVLELFRNTAALALLPVFILILGIGQTSKFALRRLRLPVADPAEHDQRGRDGRPTVRQVGALARVRCSSGYSRRWCCPRRCRRSSPASASPAPSRCWC